MAAVQDCRGIIKKFGSVADFCIATGILPNTVYAWIRREHIPVEYWDAIIAAACWRQIPGIDSHTLHAAVRIGFARNRAKQAKRRRETRTQQEGVQCQTPNM
jgi:hypothetical protein